MTLDLRRVAAPNVAQSLAELHRGTEPGDRRQVRFGAAVDPTRRLDLALGAGFSAVRGAATSVTTLERFWSLPDTVNGQMRVLISGLNPSPAAADAGVGFARPGNRFWPAALAVGLVGRDRDPIHALSTDGVGMTDIVKRTTRKAYELHRQEYEEGMARLDRMTRWLKPRAVCFVGLSGWRAAVDQKAIVGWQEHRVGGRPTYLMPSTSGLNASSQLPDFVEHLRAVKLGR